MQNRHVVGLMLAGSVVLAASVIGIAQSAPAPAAGAGALWAMPATDTASATDPASMSPTT